MIVLAIVFLALIGIIGRMKGLKTVIALVFTVAAVVFVLVPLIANGYNPIISAALVCVVISVVTLLTRRRIQQKIAGQRTGYSGRADMCRRHHAYIRRVFAHYRYRNI